MSKYRIELPGDKRFCFIGAGEPFKAFIREFVRQSETPFHATIISDKEQDTAWSKSEQESLIELTKSLNLDLEFIQGGNNAQLKDIVEKLDLNICLVMGWRFVFPTQIIEHFGGRIFNYHPSKLPAYQGPTVFSWQILNNEREACITIHQLTRKIDSGGILLQKSKQIETEKIYPKTMDDSVVELGRSVVFPELVAKLTNSSSLELSKQDEMNFEYFPKLLTEKNGVLDFSWTAEEVETFVRAFSDPYQGAIAHYKDEKYHFRRCNVHKLSEKIHPFCHGLIVNVLDEEIHVLVNSGIVALMEITDAQGELVKCSRFIVGDRLLNPAEVALQAKSYRHRL
jgi:methionyl-tRNA formyltransferase